MSASDTGLLLQPSQVRLQLTQISFGHQLLQCQGNLLCSRKSSGKSAFHLVPFGLDKTDGLVEVEDPSEAMRLVIDERHSIRCSTLTATITDKNGKRIKRTGMYSIKGINIKEYNVR